MKLIVAGGRDITDFDVVRQAIISAGYTKRAHIDEIVSGCAQGVDTVGEQFAEKHGIPVKKFPADWKKLKKAAGPIRNAQMADYADALVAVWDGQSPGTKNMINTMRQKGKPVYIYRTNSRLTDYE